MALIETIDGVEALIEALGPEGMDRAAGTWIGRRHRKDRIRLAYRRPTAPARAEHYLAFVRELECALCKAAPPNDPHHIGPRGVGQKTDDYRTIPLCRLCHERVHAGLICRAELVDHLVDVLVLWTRVAEQT